MTEKLHPLARRFQDAKDKALDAQRKSYDLAVKHCFAARQERDLLREFENAALDQIRMEDLTKRAENEWVFAGRPLDPEETRFATPPPSPLCIVPPDEDPEEGA
jgi:hypothetical protein